MADVKKLQTRIALKYDTYDHWHDESKTDLGANLVLLKGELGICAIENKSEGAQTAPTTLFKIGDGTTPFKDLKWASSLAADVYSWAKAAKIDRSGKVLRFLDAKDNIIESVTFDYYTEADVKAITNGLDSRIVALEGKFDGEDSVQGQIDALDERLETAEGTITNLGNDKLDKSVYNAYIAGKAMSDDELKSYADGKANAAQTAAEATAAGALATAKSALEAADSALGGRIDALVGNNGTIATGDAATLEAAKADAASKASAAESAAKSHAETKASEAQAAAEATAASALSSAVNTLNTKDAELVAEDTRLAGLISNNANAIVTEKSDRETAITNVTDAYTSAIATAKGEAIEAAKGETTSQVNALAETVAANTKAITDNNSAVTAEITRVEGLVTTEKGRAEAAEAALDERLDKVEAFFDPKDAEGNSVTIDKALDTLVEIQKYITDDDTAAGKMVEDIAANADAIEALSDRMDTAEDDIDALEGRATAVEGRATTLEGKVGSLETLTAGFDGTIKAAVEAAAAKGQTGIDNAALAQAAADAAQDDVDALEDVVDGVKTTAEGAAAGVTALEGRMTTAEGKITALETESAKHALKTDVETELGKKVDKATYETDKNATEQALGNVYTKTEADGKFGLKTVVEKNASDIAANTGKIGENTTAIATEKSRAEGQEAAIRSEFAAADTQINARIDTAVNTTIPAAEAAAKKHADDQVKALKENEVADNTAAISAVDGRVTALEDRFGGWFIIDCGTADTVIDETK